MSNENIADRNDKNQDEIITKPKVMLVDADDLDVEQVIQIAPKIKKVKVLAKKDHKCIIFGEHIRLVKDEIAYVTPEAKAVLAKSPLDLLKPL